MIRIGICGYGNLGKGVEKAIKYNPDMELVGIFSRRDIQTKEPLIKIEEFEKLRYDIQLMQYSGEQKDEEKMKKLENMYAILIEDEQIKKYFDLEVNFNVMIVDINKIIAESIKGVL